MSTNKLSWVVTFILLLVIAALTFYNITNAKTVYQKGEIVIEQLEEEMKIDPEIELLSKYIKSRKTATPKEVADKIAYEIITQCKLNHIADDIVVGIIEIESMWNVYATSKAKAKGLMQILIEDGVEIDTDKAYGIAYNIEKGIAIFKSKMKKANGDVSLALKYYVGGDPDYHKAVYKYLGKYTLFKINNSKIEMMKKIKIEKG
jgi:soluble lytic murein transglycosylase-like protein